MSTDTQSRAKAAPGQRVLFCLLLLVVAGLAAANFYAWTTSEDDAPRPPKSKKDPPGPLALSFDGASTKLKRTAVVPTLESPIPKDKSAVWCGSLLLAWHEFEKELAKGPLVLEGSEELCAQLTKSRKPGVLPEHYYVAAGWARAGILDRIRHELPLRFPKAPLPDWVPKKDVESMLAYAYLEANVQFEHPFQEHDEAIVFHGGDGKEEVHGFGIPKDARGGDETYRKQVQVLYDGKAGLIVDPSRTTKPYQLILARIDRPASLQAGLETVEKLVPIRKPKSDGGLPSDAEVYVPSMAWQVEHVFAELSGKLVLNSNLPPPTRTDNVAQTIDFRLDRAGAAVRSRGQLAAEWSNGGPQIISFHQPFLLVLRLRENGQPIIAMWVDNAELLQPWPPRRENAP